MKNDSAFICIISLVSLLILFHLMSLANFPALVPLLSIFALAPASLILFSLAQSFSDGSRYIYFNAPDLSWREIAPA